MIRKKVMFCRYSVESLLDIKKEARGEENAK